MFPQALLAEFERMVDHAPVKFERPRKKELTAEIAKLERLVEIYSTTDWLACEATIQKLKKLDEEMLEIMTEEAA